MTKKLSFILVIFLMFLFKNTFAQPTEVQMKKQSGYIFVGDEKNLQDGVNYFVLQRKQDFYKMFGKGRRDGPDFSKEWMLVMVMPSTKKDIQLEFNRISMKAGTFVEVYCDLNKLRGKLNTYEANPIAVCTIPKFPNVKTVNFYEERKKGLELVATVETKR